MGTDEVSCIVKITEFANRGTANATEETLRGNRSGLLGRSRDGVMLVTIESRTALPMFDAVVVWLEAVFDTP